MTQILFGDRFGKQGRIRVGAAAILFDQSHRKVMLTRRKDTRQWCLPSGGVEAGESVSEACARETMEETGLIVKVRRLVSVFSSPDRLVIYSDGSKFQLVVLGFEVEWIGGEPKLSDETTEAGYFNLGEIDTMDIFPHHLQFIQDALESNHATFIR